MSLTYDDFSELLTGGQPAGNFNPDVMVYSDMAVRCIMIILTNKIAPQPNIEADGKKDCDPGFLIRGDQIYDFSR